MYPSDYGYAVGGNDRISCLTISMNTWYESSCYKNDWLIDSIWDQWTLTPVPHNQKAYNEFQIYSGSNSYAGGNVQYCNGDASNAVRPVAYLKSSIKIKNSSESDYGSKNNPFTIE